MERLLTWPGIRAQNTSHAETFSLEAGARVAMPIVSVGPTWRVDWGYFQINTVHLKLAGVSLRDLLDCSANIDCAYQLRTERGFEPLGSLQL